MDQYQSLIRRLHDPSLKGIIFDFDGTLFNLAIDWQALKKDLILLVKKEINRETDFTPFGIRIHNLRNSNRDLYKKALTICQKYESIGLRDGVPNKVLINEITGLLGKKLGIYSMNTEKTITAFIERFKLEGKFNIIITQENCRQAKTGAQDLDHIRASWGMNKKQVVYLGDSTSDVQSGKEAGIATIVIDKNLW